MPESHTVHTTWPDCEVNEPAGHAAHDTLFDCTNVPGAHEKYDMVIELLDTLPPPWIITSGVLVEIPGGMMQVITSFAPDTLCTTDVHDEPPTSTVAPEVPKFVPVTVSCAPPDRGQLLIPLAPGQPLAELMVAVEYDSNGWFNEKYVPHTTTTFKLTPVPAGSVHVI